MQEVTLKSLLEGYKRAQGARDPQAATDLFTKDATYHETPFGGHMTLRLSCTSSGQADHARMSSRPGPYETEGPPQ